ncbi:MAG: hypothetical protein GC150_02760 [Rhizobiales bacterium]|nr:hypothetical protein [Hyphomicrobiales bacterium]
MQENQYYWSARARSEFAALFDDANYSEVFRRAVADALVRGWGGNRDKPFWALAVLAAALGAAQRARGGGGDGMDIVWLAPREVIGEIAEAEPEDIAGLEIRTELDGDALVMHTPDGVIRLTPHRVRVLKKLGEFLLAADEFAHAQDVMAVFGRLAGEDEATFAGTKDAARALSRIAYRYRTDHFLDGHAGSAFSIVRTWLAARGYEVDDETVLEFWRDPENARYKTYEASFAAFQSFIESIALAQSVQGEASGIAVDDPSVAGALVSGLTGTEELDVDAALAMEEHFGSASAADDLEADEDEMAGSAAGQAADAPERLGDSDLRLLGQRDITLLTTLTEIGRFGLGHPLASLRLIAFHPVQSGISNGLRTGRWKIPLERRVTCEEARPYEAVLEELGEVGERTKGWLEVALALQLEGEALEGDAEAARQSGLAVLARSRSKSLQKDPAALRRAFKAVEPALIRARSLASEFAASVQRRYPESRAADLARQFKDDIDAFSVEFRRRYIEQPGDDGSPADSTAANDEED